MQLFCHQWGSRGLPVLALHGHPGRGDCMEVFAESLVSTGEFQVVAPDLRGYGRSQVRDPYTLQAHLWDLQALVETRGWQRFGILGWSLGGILGLELALQQPQRVLGLTLIASSACPQGSHPPVPWWLEANTALVSLLNLLLPGHPWVMALGKWSLYRYLIGRHTPPTYRFLARHAVPAYLQTSPYAHQALRQALRQPYNRLPALASLGIPSLVLAGARDVHITPESSRCTAQALGAKFRCYEGVAHLFPWEIPEQVQADVRQWWLGLRRSESSDPPAEVQR
ncbi:MAG: alpha/beta hydrolase [Thermostichales cyanobacterium BF4_bins_65]